MIGGILMVDDFIATDNGDIKIAEDVIVRISAISAREVEGVVGLGSGSSWGDFIGKKSAAKGIKVQTTDDGTIIEVHVTVKFGVKITEVARKLQETVKNAVEAYAGIENTTVNVYIDGIDAEKEKDAEPGNTEAETEN